MQIRRCVYCLQKLNIKIQTKDHIFPRSWHTFVVDSSIQIWTVPSCEKCNKKFGFLEDGLFLRLSMCIPTSNFSARGIPLKWFRRICFLLGKDLSSMERKSHALMRLSENIRPYKDLVGADVLSPPDDGMRRPYAIKFPRSDMDMFAYKLACALEFKLRSNYLGNKRKVTYWLYSVSESSAKDKNTKLFDHTLEVKGLHANQGDGFKVSYMLNKKFDQVIYRVTIWGIYQFYLFLQRKNKVEDNVEYIPLKRVQSVVSSIVR